MDFNLSEEQLALQMAAREFVDQEIKPTILEREKVPDPRERFPWDIIEKGSQLGFRTLSAPVEFGGGGASVFEECLVGEELGAGDLGIATIFDQASRLFRQFYRFSTPIQREKYLNPLIGDHRALLSIAGTEPEVGSDTWLPYDEPGAGAQTFAERRGDTYVINGHKRFISITNEAALYCVIARTDRVKRYSEGGLSAFLVPRGTPGITIGPIWDKIGQRMSNNADLILDNVVVPADTLILEEGGYLPALQRFFRGGNTEVASLCLGVGRAAYEEAVRYAKQRVQGGRPIIDHQMIGAMLADMATRLEAARTLVWRAAWAADEMEPFDARLPGMAKLFTTEAVFEVCRLAMEVHGGSGIMKNLPLEKYLRDASTRLHADGTNQIQKLRILKWIKAEG
ncbi:MAG: acyl-CoA/acyl-ACP dehydrogenase [Chloroflexi bacterium]|nr:acyl-CoA/acyl-ACP dehydrogenase [Chloroflexota bacterium]